MLILLNRNFLFISAIIIGLLFGDRLVVFSSLNLPILILIMTFSMIELNILELLVIRKVYKQAVSGILLNHFLFSIIILAAGFLITDDESMRAGFVLCAASPPGIGIIPFTYILSGNVKFSAIAVFWSFIASLLITPFLIDFFIQENLISTEKIAIMLTELILIPLAAGQLLRRLKAERVSRKLHSPVVNIGFAIIFAIMIGINRNSLLSGGYFFLKALIVSFISVFGLAVIIKLYLKTTKIPVPVKKSVILLGTIKNSIFAATAGFSLLNRTAAIPGLVLSIVIIFYLMMVEKICYFDN